MPNLSTHDISIIIVSFNTRDLTIQCVRSVISACDDITAQIIVVDNQSSDGSSDALREIFPNIKVIDSPVNGGFGYGNNLGLKEATGRFILFLNPDTQIPNNFVKSAINIMQEKPNIGILGPKVLNEDGTTENSLMRDLRVRQLLIMTVIPARILRAIPYIGDFRYASLDKTQTQSVEAVSGCAMITRKEVINTVGGFDSRIFLYAEELELCSRIRNAGWEIIFEPSLHIMHVGGASTGVMNPWKAVEMARGHLLLMRITRGKAIAWIAALLMAIRDLFRTPYFGAIFVLNNFQHTNATDTWWCRLKFELKCLLSLPKGQNL